MQSDMESVVESLTGTSIDIIPFLDYLLQDLWELGTDVHHVTAMFRTYLPLPYAKRSVLDLGCGKGAVSIFLANELGCKIDGFDVFPAFIDHCKNKCIEYSVVEQCSFAVQDIRQVLERNQRYDAVVYGGVGNLYGDIGTMLCKLKQAVVPSGLLYLDESYQDTGIDYLSYEAWLSEFQAHNLTVIETYEPSLDEISTINRENQRKIEERGAQLIDRNPDIASLIEEYIESQRQECIELETDVKPICWLLRS